LKINDVAFLCRRYPYLFPYSNAGPSEASLASFRAPNASMMRAEKRAFRSSQFFPFAWGMPLASKSLAGLPRAFSERDKIEIDALPTSALRHKRTFRIVGGSGRKVQRLQNACVFRRLELRRCD